jgi:hypothetical protein
MDMYKKRKMRQQEKKNNNQEEKLTKVGINWYIPSYGKTYLNPYKQRILN